ncbi:MAG TPA: methyltransferase [Desulfobacterales bacterium]|nr:methyltransferase [Desulfobacterales bacterium]
MKQAKQNPSRVLELSGSYWQTCALHAGVKLDIFTLIGNRQLTNERIAQSLKGDERGVATLLNALAAMNLLVKKGEKYSNTSESKTFLSKDAPHYVGHIIMHHHHLMASWADLDRAVQAGSPVRASSMHSTEERRESFLLGMFNLAMNLAPQLVTQIDLSNRYRLLDLGGGPGTYAIHFCLNNPRLKATVFDLPTTRPFAQNTIEKFNLADRIEFLEGNYIQDDVPGFFDAVWLSHILHAEGPEDCRKIIRKAVSALKPGGMIMIHDFIMNNEMDGPLFPALFSLNMLLATSEGRSYSEKQITDMLLEVGVTDIRRIPFQGPNDSAVITGVVR